MAPEHNTEIEVKIHLRDCAAIELRLQEAGFYVSVPRVRESNDLFDTSEHVLRDGQMLLRLRQAGERALITWKGHGRAGPHKSRPELETSIGSLETLSQILGQLGYYRVFRYEKYRTEYTDQEGRGAVMVDQTPIGDFLEIEGPPDWIDAVAAKLGFAREEYVLESYGSLYLDRCKQQGVIPGNMVFAPR